jgi:hypothetical protein
VAVKWKKRRHEHGPSEKAVRSVADKPVTNVTTASTAPDPLHNAKLCTLSPRQAAVPATGCGRCAADEAVAKSCRVGGATE